MSRDFRNVQWKETLWHNLLRATGTGVIWAIIIPFINDPSAPNAFLMPIMLPIGYLIFGLPFGLFLVTLSNYFNKTNKKTIGGMIGFFAMICALAWVSIGDPLVALLHKFVPKAVPVENPGFFNLSFIMWVLKPENTQEVVLPRG